MANTSLPTSFKAADGSAAAALDALLVQALADGASDLHFESQAAQFRVRFRIDGRLRVAATPALSLRDAMLTRLKVLARMDIAEKRLPQDGRIAYEHQNQWIDLRVSSLPTLHGEKLVLRVLGVEQTPPELDALGYETDELARLNHALHTREGMLLMTGPTGSGKTRSLYSCLHRLNRADLNISTLEDPVEMQLAGINQVQIHERAGLHFASALRALLRQDPDVIMLGEIRDIETAEIAIGAAQTGHLVLSTLHTNDAPSTLTRLRLMGVARHQIAASVRLVVAQRLLRRLCLACRRPLALEQHTQAMERLPPMDEHMLPPSWVTSAQLFEAVGCAQCQDGYRGRVGVFQVMPVGAAMQRLLIEDASPAALAAQSARESVRTLRQSGWLKALQGVTSLDEVLALTPDD
ncbi:MAG: type pilus assembly ATPase PilB [Pseudomonadota bacterium]